MNYLINKIGEVHSSLESEGKTKGVQKIAFNEDSYFVNVELQETKEVSKRNAILMKNEATYYCLFLKIENESRGYHYNRDSGELILIKALSHDQYEVSLCIVDPDGEVKVSSVVDYHFDGDSAFSIVETYDFLKKEYSSNNELLKLLFLGFLIIVSLVYGVNIYLEETAKNQQVAPKPFPPISPAEEKRLKSIASIDIIKSLRKEIKEISGSPSLNDGKKRIVVLTQGRFTTLQPVRAVAREDGTYYYPNPRLKRGALNNYVEKSYEQSYAGSGYTFSSSGVYSKGERENYEYVPSLLDSKIDERKLTEDCLLNYTLVELSETIVYKRDDASIIYKFKDLNASSFLDKAEDILGKCPSYFEEIKISQGKFQGELILFAEERL